MTSVDSPVAPVQPCGSLAALFRPRSIAVLGASPEEAGKVGGRTVRDLDDAKWPGRLFLVSHRHAEIDGRKAYRSLKELPAAPDVVLARVGAKHVPAAVDDAIAAGAKYILILASGFAETGAEGRKEQGRILAEAREAGLRILGPQCIGVFNFVDGVPMSLGSTLERVKPRCGNVALVAQSGAIINLIALQLQARLGVNFSYLVSCGNASDITPEEVLDHLATDAATEVIALYLEGVTNADKFFDAARRAVVAGKAVVVLHPGRSKEGRRVAESHTASVAVEPDLFDAVCDQLGVCRCSDETAFTTAVGALALNRRGGRAVGFVSPSGGACAIFADLCSERHLGFPSLAPETAQELERLLPWYLKSRLPLDMGTEFFDTDKLRRALRAIEADPAVSTIVIHAFTHNESLLRPVEKARAIVEEASASAKPFIVVWHNAMDPEADIFRQSGSVLFLEGLAAAADCARLISDRAYSPAAPTWMKGLANLEENNVSSTGPMWRHFVERAKGSALCEYEAKALLRELGMPVPPGDLARDDRAAKDAAARIGYPVVAKLQGEQILHKSDSGFVALNIKGGPALEDALASLEDRRRRVMPRVSTDGVLIEKMIDEDHVEVLVTLHSNRSLGHFVTIGFGGLFVEVVGDLVHCKAPAGPEEVAASLHKLKLYPVLAGIRGHGGYDLQALCSLVASLSRLVVRDDISLLEINPVFVLVKGKGCLIMDAVMRR
jgi:acyl-CoA synthetase (NDP forming)